MDPLTHTLAALMLSRAAPRRLSPQSTITLLLAANVPELDYLYALGGAAAFYEHHGGWTHSLLGAVPLAAATAYGVARWARRRTPGTAPPLRSLLAVAGLGTATHLLLDWITPAGARLLWPFRNTQFALDWFTLDFWLVLLLLAGMALPALLGLIAEEIGARRDDRSRRRGARVALVACLLLVGTRASLHGEAVAHLESRLYPGGTPLRSAALPTPLNPFRWQGVVETSMTYELVEVRLVGAERPLAGVTTIHKPGRAPALEVALAAPAARLFLSRARFPQVELLPAPGEGWVIRLQDLATVQRWAGARQFQVRIELNRGFEVERESFSYGHSPEGPPR